MGFKLSSAISIARGVLNDTTPDYRYSDADLLEYGNGALRALPAIKPSLLYTEGDLQCEADQALQSISFDDAHSLVAVLRIKNGAALTRFDKDALDAFMPGWMAATSAAAQQWAPNADDPVRFYLNPPAIAGQVLVVLYVRIPGPFTADEDTGLPETITESLSDYIVGMAESRNDESVNSGRATQFINQFAARLSGQAKG
jgi:hypothetical protein